MGVDRPLAKTDGLLTDEVDGELLVYDDEHHVACRLNRAAAIVWRSCDGDRSVADLVTVLAKEFGELADEDMVLVALDSLVEHGLLESGYEPRSKSASRWSRRNFIRRAGVTAVTVPVVFSIVVPSAMAATSNTGYYGSYEPLISDRRLKQNIRTLKGAP